MIDLISEESKELHHYKANMHSHSTISDGHWTVEEMKKRYMEQGYSIIAFTDHEAFIPHNDLSDENFLAINGVEMAIREAKPGNWLCRQDVHLNFIATRPEITKQLFFHKTKYFYKPIWSFTPADLDIDPAEPEEERVLTGEYINHMISKAHEEGFLVSYNHPNDMFQRYPNYIQYKGLDFLELVNGCCVSFGKMDATEVLDDYLDVNERPVTLGADDNHNSSEPDVPGAAVFRAYTIIFAKDLKYETIIDALKNGQCYVGTGDFYYESPRILSLQYDPETYKVKIKTTDAWKIAILTDTGFNRSKEAPHDGTLREAEFEVIPEARFFRFEITGEKGYKTYTRGYFLFK